MATIEFAKAQLTIATKRRWEAHQRVKAAADQAEKVVLDWIQRLRNEPQHAALTMSTATMAITGTTPLIDAYADADGDVRECEDTLRDLRVLEAEIAAVKIAAIRNEANGQ